MIMLLADAVPPPRQEGGPQGEKKWIMLESFDSPFSVFGLALSQEFGCC